MKDINGKNIPTNRNPTIDQKNTSTVNHPTIEQEKCVGCGNCADACPMNAITIEEGKAKIQSDRCRNCRKCISACLNDAIE